MEQNGFFLSSLSEQAKKVKNRYLQFLKTENLWNAICVSSDLVSEFQDWYAVWWSGLMVLPFWLSVGALGAIQCNFLVWWEMSKLNLLLCYYCFGSSGDEEFSYLYPANFISPAFAFFKMSWLDFCCAGCSPSKSSGVALQILQLSCSSGVYK